MAAGVDGAPAGVTSMGVMRRFFFSPSMGAAGALETAVGVRLMELAAGAAAADGVVVGVICMGVGAAAAAGVGAGTWTASGSNSCTSAATLTSRGA